MGGRSLDLAALPPGLLADLDSEIAQTLCLILKVSTSRATERTERKLSDALTRAWKGSARSAVNSSLGKAATTRPTRRNVAAFLKALGLKLRTPLTKKQIELIGSKLRSIWRTAKSIGAKEAKGTFSFSLKDTKAIAAANKQQVFWVGQFYDEQLSKRIVAVSRDIVIESGLSQQEAGRALRKALSRELGLTPGGVTQWASNVPARYAGNVDLYFRQVASTASHQCRTFGKLTSFQEAGITRFRLINPNDERTGKICQHMHGQTFTVRTGVTHMSSILGAKNPADVKRIAPWLSGDDLAGKLKGKPRGSSDASAALEQAGVILPPFHSLCRTEPVVVG